MTGLLRSTFALLAALTLAAATAAPATAQGTDQYEIDIPGPGGGGPSEDNGDDTSEGVPLTPEQAGALDDYGVDGEGAAIVAKETSGDAERDEGTRDGEGASASAGSSDSSGPSASAGELAADTDSGGSALLPILLISAVAAAVGFFVARKRGWPARQA